MSNDKKILYSDMLQGKKNTSNFQFKPNYISCVPLSERNTAMLKKQWFSAVVRQKIQLKKQWFNGVIGAENDSVCYVQVQQ